jgi:Tfp pilus assembly protein PilO
VRRIELTIVLAVAAVGLMIAFWLLAISPKRSESASLKQDIDQLHASLAQAQQAAAAGAQAQKSFPVEYRRLVVLGKAVPADAEQASLLVQLQRLATRAGVGFQSIDLSSSGAVASSSTTEAGAVASTESTSSSGSTASSSSASTSSSGSTTSGSTSSSTPTSSSSTGASSGSATTPPATAPATEADAASLPIGASVGPAGLPVMPYELKFTGGFFQIANFLDSLDGLVHGHRGLIDVNGRLITVDAFGLQPVEAQEGSFNPVPKLTADLSVTTYVTPPEQGITAGASPSGPAPATPTPTSGTTPAPAATSTPTSSTTTAGTP